MKKRKFVMVYGQVELPERREIKPEGRIVLFGRELSAEETKNYCKANSNIKIYD